MNEAKKKGFGTFSFERFKGRLVALSPISDCFDAMVLDFVEKSKEVGSYEQFMNAFEEFIRDDSLSYAEKDTLYFDGRLISHHLTIPDYLKWLWSLLAPEKPWPREGMDEDLEIPKSYLLSRKPSEKD